MFDTERLLRETRQHYGFLNHLRTRKSRRRVKDDEDALFVRNQFVSDRAKLLSSKARRRMAWKTQVFTYPDNPYLRTRGFHVDEVEADSIILSEILGLNNDLVSAIALGHDIGHVPFGHAGEAWMAQKMGKLHFCHEVMAPVISEKVERRGRGLNLTWHVLDGMMRHSGNLATPTMSPEAWLVRYTDKIAYLFADWSDIADRMKFPVSCDLRSLANEFGSTQRERTTTAMIGLILESAEHERVSFECSEMGKKFQLFRTLMYEVYPCVSKSDVSSMMEVAYHLLEKLKLGDPFLLLSLMTDRDVEIIVESNTKDMQTFNHTSLCEVLPYLNEIGEVDLCDPGLNW